jgi:thiol-disulfide isomerase/thioredoxin
MKPYKLLAAICTIVSLALPVVSLALPVKGQAAPPFQVVTTSGQKLSLANYRGSVLVIEFFATWCGGCKDSLPHLADLQKQYGGQGLHILGLNVGQGDTLEDVRKFVVKKKIGYPVAMASEDLVYDDYGIRMVPTLLVINKKGVLVEKLTGFNEGIRKMLETTVRKLVAE